MLSHINHEYKQKRDIDTMEILEQLFHERNSSFNTQELYKRSAKYYSKLTGHTLKELLKIADDEETNNIRWKNTQTRKWLIKYREYLFDKYSKNTARSYLTAIITFYRHFEITIPPLPYYSTKNVKTSPPIKYTDLPDREILSECIKISKPVMAAAILFMSSSGLSRIDFTNLTIQDYLEATKDYHNEDNIKAAASVMLEQNNIIPTFYLSRQKTGVNYFTFCSPEATKAINQYILTRKETLRKDKPLFKINKRYMSHQFTQLNEHFHLGKAGTYNRMRPHMLRKYHASQLAEAGMSTDHINLLQGRKVAGVAHESYIRIKPETLKKEYIEALPYLVIDDSTKYKTELEEVKSSNTVLQDAIVKKDEQLKELDRLLYEFKNHQYRQENNI